MNNKTVAKTCLLLTLLLFFIAGLNVSHASRTDNIILIGQRLELKEPIYVKELYLVNSHISCEYVEAETVYIFNSTITCPLSVSKSIFVAKTSNIQLFLYNSSIAGSITGVNLLTIETSSDIIPENAWKSKDIKEFFEKTFPLIKTSNVEKLSMHVIVEKQRISKVNIEGLEIFMVHGGVIEDSSLGGVTIMSATSLNNVKLKWIYIRGDVKVTGKGIRVNFMRLDGFKNCTIDFDGRKYVVEYSKGRIEGLWGDDWGLAIENSECLITGHVSFPLPISIMNSRVVYEAELEYLRNPIYRTPVLEHWKRIRVTNSSAVLPKDFSINYYSTGSNISFYVKNVTIYSGNDIKRVICDNLALEPHGKIVRVSGPCERLKILLKDGTSIDVLCNNCEVYTPSYRREVFLKNTFYLSIPAVVVVGLLTGLVIKSCKWQMKMQLEEIAEILSLVAYIICNELWFRTIINAFFNVSIDIIPTSLLTLSSLIFLFYMCRKRTLRVKMLVLSAILFYAAFSAIAYLQVYVFVNENVLLRIISFTSFACSSLALAIYFLKYSNLISKLDGKHALIIVYALLISLVIISNRKLPAEYFNLKEMYYSVYNEIWTRYILLVEPFSIMLITILFALAGYVVAKKLRVTNQYLYHAIPSAFVSLPLLYSLYGFYEDQVGESLYTLSLVFSPTYDTFVNVFNVFLGAHFPTTRLINLVFYYLQFWLTGGHAIAHYVQRVGGVCFFLVLHPILMYFSPREFGQKFRENFSMVLSFSYPMLHFMCMSQTVDRGFWLLLLAIMLFINRESIKSVITAVASSAFYFTSAPASFIIALVEFIRRKKLVKIVSLVALVTLILMGYIVVEHAKEAIFHPVQKLEGKLEFEERPLNEMIIDLLKRGDLLKFIYTSFVIIIKFAVPYFSVASGVTTYGLFQLGIKNIFFPSMVALIPYILYFYGIYMMFRKNWKIASFIIVLGLSMRLVILYTRPVEIERDFDYLTTFNYWSIARDLFVVPLTLFALSFLKKRFVVFFVILSLLSFPYYATVVQQKALTIAWVNQDLLKTTIIKNANDHKIKCDYFTNSWDFPGYYVEGYDSDDITLNEPKEVYCSFIYEEVGGTSTKDVFYKIFGPLGYVNIYPPFFENVTPREGYSLSVLRETPSWKEYLIMATVKQES